ncbi:fungal-specific transcription factor domain-containing protein [Daedaleopsis nitida]|nr:fungal-specific transcription factor domain-containing protein [Daedaleopsis nitida]
MPLSAARKDGADKERTAKSQEQELKRARGAISCAECRRLKLKCDKTIPCSSCKRRGCASICPNGSLTTGQGTRFILADTDRLHRKIAEMSDRIRQLEDGLAILQSSVAREPHPLLALDLLRIKSGLELHSAAEGIFADSPREPVEEDGEEPAYVDAFGTLAVRDDGAATFYGRSAGSESLLLDEKPSLTISTLSRPTPTGHLGLPDEINRLASTFPHGPPEFPVIDLQEIIQGYLPPWPRASQLRDLYLEQAPWFFGAVTHRQLVDEVFPLFYEEAAEEARTRVASGLVGSAEAFNLPIPSSTHASSHELGLMLVVFCFGALTDPTLPSAPHNTEAERYYQLTRAALSLEPVMDRPPSIATVQVLSLMGIYQGMVADEHSIEITWALMGLASKLAQSTGLHRDCSRFKLSAAETQKRRALFWELFITDCFQALATGRLPTFELQFVDTELPADPEETLADDGTPQLSFPAWKARWGKECIYPIVMGTLTAQPPKYSLILDLDRRIRDMTLPKYAMGPPPQNSGLKQTMSHYMPTNYLHLTLLYVHRVFFARALVDFPTDPMRSPFAPSFLAGYRSASALLLGIREQFALFPTQIARFWVLWTHAFSACVMMGSVVTRGGTTKTAQAALGELRVACDLFERAAEHGGRAVKFVPILRKLLEKAQTAYFQGLQPLRPDIFTPRAAENENDELSIFSGRTPRTVATKSNRPQRISPSMSSSSAAPSDHSSPGSQNGSDTNPHGSQSPVEAFPGLDSSYRMAVHPELVAELRTFEGQLDAQISEASSYYEHAGQGQQYVYDDTHQAYAQHHQVPMQHTGQPDSQAAWYQANPNAEQSQTSTTAPSPIAAVPPQQLQPQHQQTYPVQYSHSQPTTQQHVPEHSTQPQLSHPQSYHQPPPAAEALPTSIAPHPHDIPVYGGAYSKSGPPGHAHGQSHYHENPYSHIAANTSSQSLHDYPAYAGHTHSVPDQRSELWTVNVNPPPAAEYASQPPSGYDAHTHTQAPAEDPYAYHARVPYQQPSHAHPHPRSHPADMSGRPQPQPLQPQHTGGGHQHHDHPGVEQYAQTQHYTHTQHAPQQQHMMAAHPHPQPPPMSVMQSGYSLQESWTTFFQQELPGPPGGRR